MKRLTVLGMVMSLVLTSPGPAVAADPQDPAGNPPTDQGSAGVGESPNITQQTHTTFQRGDVFVATSGGHVQWRTPDGTLNAELDTGEGGYTTGMAFDDRGHLFLTGFGTSKIYEFDTTGELVGTFATLNGTTDCSPESLVFDAAGNLYVGQADCSRDVLKFAPNGSLLARYDVARERRGSDWIDLEPDQCTLRYTSEGLRVLQYDVCGGTQLGDWGSGLTTSYALRMLPDDPFNPDLLVASTENIRRMHLGSSITGYDAAGEDCWFALNLDPDAITFWSADFCTSNVYRFDMSTGAVVSSFNTGTAFHTVFGLAIFGELSTGTVRDCSSEDLSGAFGEVLPGAGDRTTVRYDARFLVDEQIDVFAEQARAIAEKVQERAEYALDLYGTTGVLGQTGLGFTLPGTLRIEISCSINVGPVPIDTNGLVSEPGVIQLRLEAVQEQLAKGAVDGFPPNGGWNANGAAWKNLVDHEVFHAIQYEYESLYGRFIGGEQTLIESPAMLAQDLFPEVDNLPPGGPFSNDEYLEAVRLFSEVKPSVDEDDPRNAARYYAPSVFQYWGERFGPAGESDLERRVAGFLKVLIDDPRSQTRAYSDAIGGDALAALRDYYLAHYGLRASNISAGENAAYAILDAESGPAYAPLLLRGELDLSFGGASDSARIEPWAGDIYEITNIPSDATHVALRLDTGFSGLLNRGWASAIVPINPGNEFLVDPQLLFAGPNVFRPIERRIPVVGRDRVAIVFVNGNSRPVDFIVSVEAVSGVVGMQFVDPTGNDPHRIQSPTAEPILLEVVPTINGQAVPGDLARSAFQVQIGALNASVRTVDYRSGVYHLSVWAPAGLGPGSYPMTVTFADTGFGVPGGLVIEQDAPPPTQVVRSADFGDLGQGQTASADAILTSGAQTASFGLTWTGSDFDLTLTAPSGRVIAESATDPDVTVTETATSVTIAVANPEGGVWRLDVVGIDVPAPEPVRYEVTETGAPLYGELFVADAGQAGLPFDVTFAWSSPDGGIGVGDVVAGVTDPAGVVRRFPLRDDGAHGDVGSGDGVYGDRLWATDLPGTYQIVVTASGTSMAEAAVQRQAVTTVSLGAKVDGDGDGIADGAEPLFGLDASDPSDGATDHDGDGLGLAVELAAGTDAASWDTDAGGENDPSELAAGRDPRDAADDGQGPGVLIGVRAEDGRTVAVDVRTSDGSGSVRLYRLTDAGRVDLGVLPGSGAAISDGPLPLGEYSYLGIGISVAGAESGPFVAGPVAVGDDVTPPDFRIHLNGGQWEATDVEVSVTFTDLTEAVDEMRLATSEAALLAAPWVPFSGFTTATVPSDIGQHFVFAQIRDAAGNESRVASGFIFLIDRTPPDSAAGPLAPEYNSSPIDVPYTAADDLSGVASVALWWRFSDDDGATWTAWAEGPSGSASPISFAFPSGPGRYEFYSVATDNAGNVEPPESVADVATTHVPGDTTPPTSQAGPLNAVYTSSSVAVPYTAADDASGVASVELWARYRPNEARPWGAWGLTTTATSSPITYPFASGDGSYEFYSLAIDGAGNREAAPALADVATRRDAVDDPPDYAWSSLEAISDAGQTCVQGSATAVDDRGSVSVRWRLYGVIFDESGAEYRSLVRNWGPATPLDGAFDERIEDFSILDTRSTQPWSYYDVEVEIKIAKKVVLTRTDRVLIVWSGGASATAIPGACF